MVPFQLTRDSSEDKAECGITIWVHCLLPLFSPPAFVFNQIHSFASSTAFCASNLHLILLQYSGATGDLGSCAEQQRRPSSADGTRAPFSWSLQKEWGQNSQKETAGLLQMSHWCHGHSHFPEDGRRERKEAGISALWRQHQPLTLTLCWNCSGECKESSE